MKTARNVAIILALAAAVTYAPGGLTSYETVVNIVFVIFFAGMAFFAYRMYMENRTTLFDLPDQHRLILYASTTAIVFALIATRRFWNEGGALILVWFAVIAFAAYGFMVVVRSYRDY